MEKKGFKWQIFLAALLLLTQSAVLLMPWLQITGDRFVSVAMEINREAEQIAAGKARENRAIRRGSIAHRQGRNRLRRGQ